MHFYFFTSTNSKDDISRISIFTNSINKAVALAHNYFIRNGFKGKPVRLAI